MIRKHLHANGLKLFYPEDKCIYCGKPLGKGYYQFTFRGDEPYHCMDWGPTCRDIYEQLQTEKKMHNLRKRIANYSKI